jgi:hypothetical protein
MQKVIASGLSPDGEVKVEGCLQGFERRHLT